MTLVDVPVLVTGAGGFIGSHLVERLVAEGARVRAFARYNARGSLGWLDAVPAETRTALDVRLGDIRDARFVEEAVAGVEVVFHLAALIAIPYSYHAPESFVQTNVQGTLNVLEGARRAGIRRLIHTSTSEVYGTPETLPITELHSLNAQSPYAATKVAADQMAIAYQRSFGVPALVLRPFNTYGPRQSQRAVLPTMIRQMLAGREEIRLGRLDPRRDLTFVADTVDGFVRAASAQGVEGTTIQLGTGRTESIAELFALAARLTGSSARPVEDAARLRPDASEVMVLQSDPARARALLGWEATTSLEDGLAQTIAWIRANPELEIDRVQLSLTHADPRIPLAEPSLGGNAAAYLAECLATNYVSSVGPFVGRFEREFAAAVGARFAVACSSGTAALHLAFAALGIGPGDEVLVPTLTFIASANPVRYLGATPVLVDSEPQTLNMDPGLVITELERRARTGARQPAAIEVVHLVGHPAETAPVLEAAGRLGIPVVEDASEALGAAWTGGPLAGRQVGTAGLLGCFSFNGNKLITTGGGGMVTTDDQALARRVRHLSTQARLPGRTYDHDETGYNYRLTNIAAALGVAQLERLPDLLAARRANAAAYDDALAAFDGIEPAARAPWADPSFWLYTARLATLDAAERDRVLDALAAAGIDARPIWTPLHRTHALADAPRIGGAVADAIFAGAISLPSSSTLAAADRERVIAALGAALRAEG